MDLKNLVGWTYPDAMALLDEFEPVPEARPERFRFAEFGEGPKLLRVTAEGQRLAGGKLCLRYARIQTVAADVATVMVYPTADPARLPIFACEWVVVGERAHVLVLDVEFAGEATGLRERLRPVLTPLHETFSPTFPLNRDLPEWFTEIREDWAIYSSGDVAALARIREAATAYLKATIDVAYRPNLPVALAGPDHSAVAAYKHHHAEHSPGFALMVPKAGEEWTTEFLHRWHFGTVL
jgi:hypothetical protein